MSTAEQGAADGGPKPRKLNCEDLRELARAQIQHEDRLFADRIRNFLTAASFLLAAFAASGRVATEDPQLGGLLRLSVSTVGALLSWFYLEIGARDAHGIRFWRAVLERAERDLDVDGWHRVNLPDTFLRRCYYDRNTSQFFRTVFRNTNFVQGLCVPGLIGTLWLGLLGRLVYTTEFPGCATSIFFHLLFWAAVIIFLFRFTRLAPSVRRQFRSTEIDGLLPPEPKRTV